MFFADDDESLPSLLLRLSHHRSKTLDQLVLLLSCLACRFPQQHKDVVGVGETDPAVYRLKRVVLEEQQ